MSGTPRARLRAAACGSGRLRQPFRSPLIRQKAPAPADATVSPPGTAPAPSGTAPAPPGTTPALPGTTPAPPGTMPAPLRTTPVSSKCLAIGSTADSSLNSPAGDGAVQEVAGRLAAPALRAHDRETPSPLSKRFCSPALSCAGSPALREVSQPRRRRQRASAAGSAAEAAPVGEAAAAALEEVEAEIASLEAAGCRVEDLALYIDALHRYNEVKDAAQVVMGRIAVLDGVTVREVHNRYTVLPELERN